MRSVEFFRTAERLECREKSGPGGKDDQPRWRDLRADEAGSSHGLIEEDVHNPFGGVAVPFLGDGT